MTAETVLTDGQVETFANRALYSLQAARDQVRNIERAVLQSPEVQQRMESYAAAYVQEVLHEEAKPDNIKRAEYYGEGYVDGWKAALEHAARIVSGYVGCEEIAAKVSALIPSTPARPESEQ